MHNSIKYKSVRQALLQRLMSIRVPRIIEIKKRLDEGEKLSEQNINYLQRILRETRENKKYFDKVPEMEQFYIKLVHYYHKLITQAVENEMK